MKSKKNKYCYSEGSPLYLYLRLGIVFALLCLPLHSAYAQGDNKSIGRVIEISENAFAEKVYDFRSGGGWRYLGTKPAVIDFYAVWCGPCKRLRPRLEQLANEYGDEIIIYSIDAEKAKELSTHIGIRAFPTLLFIPVKGQPVMTEGLLSLKLLRQQVESIKK